GGTLDKMESIPGYSLNVSPSRFISVLKKCGCSMIGQTPELVPADRKLYALSDVTATVPSIPLISASIMSKKLAEGADSLVLDVKWGKGAFMKTRKQAKVLAKTMVEIGKRMKRGMIAVLTNMNQPLGRTVGNAVEVRESIDTLKGQGPDDLVEITLALGARMLVLGKAAKNPAQAVEILKKKLSSGAAFEKFKEMVKFHGGKIEYLDNPDKLPSARFKTSYPSPRNGHLSKIDAELIGRACIVLGAGRRTVDDKIDHSAGITKLVKIGEKIKKGQSLLTLHANNKKKIEDAKTVLAAAFGFSKKRISPPKLITDIIT
ncbi:MAG: thymidine phosphorylase, partial [Kiritimatiellae bacterium]|nr:thymidine phosphorylase [Kiritimatiellia bacterium]